MTNYSNSTTQMWLDFEALSPETIDLSPESIAQAVELSTNIPNEQQQWQTYLNVLALYAFEEWLGSRSIDLTIDREYCSVLQPATANVIDAVCNLKVNEFNICLMAAGSLIDEEVTLPRAVVDLPEFVPHFYVLVEVQEEQETAVVHSFLSYEQLVNRRASVNLEADEDWTYQLPLTWFEADPDRLLLFLRCLEQMAMSLPSSQSDRTMQLSQIRSELEALLPQLESPERQLWEVLTWEQGTAVLTNPELLNWVYQLQRGEITSASSQISLQQHLSDILQLLTQPAVNVGRWLWNELDELAQEVSWVLLPSLAPAAAMRSPVEEFEAIVTQLRQAGVEIPTQARGAYRDLQLAGMPLRLYAVTWPVLSESIPEWTLLLVLGATPGTSLPPGLRLRVSDQTGVLVEQVLDTQASDSYFFTSVVGSWEEKFIVTVGLTPNIEQTLPPFSFNPER
ncbi:MAG: DUF1822 family protein [Cyanobacteriota bacterium]|nr:DUF1822 family protein [Cyanobacteriota bacterium]